MENKEKLNVKVIAMKQYVKQVQKVLTLELQLLVKVKKFNSKFKIKILNIMLYFKQMKKVYLKEHK